MTEDWQVCGAMRHVGDDHDPTVEWRDLGLLCEACYDALVDRRDIAITNEMVERAARALFAHEEARDKHVECGMLAAREWDSLPAGCYVHASALERARVVLAAAMTSDQRPATSDQRPAKGHGVMPPHLSESDSPWRDWWIFYIDPTETQGSGWVNAGSISGPFTADEAIARTVGRRFPDRPYWAFALDKGEHGAYYGLHYPPGLESHSAQDKRLGPAGYVAERDRSAHEPHTRKLNVA